MTTLNPTQIRKWIRTSALFAEQSIERAQVLMAFGLGDARLPNGPEVGQSIAAYVAEVESLGEKAQTADEQELVDIGQAMSAAASAAEGLTEALAKGHLRDFEVDADEAASDLLMAARARY